MKKWILVIVVVVIIMGLYLLLNNLDIFSNKAIKIEDREDVEEFMTSGNHTVFIEKNDDMEYLLKIYDSTTNTETEVEEIRGSLYGINWSKDGKYFTVNEGTSVVKTTYIVPIDNIEKIASLTTIGNVVWSPNSTKLLIGAENSKKRVVETELNGTIDLAVFGINSKTVEPLLEANEHTDYWPKYWDENNNIGYTQVKDGKEEDLSFIYEPSPEEMAMEIIMIKKKDKESVKKVVSLLPEIDLNKLEEIYGLGSVTKLLDWLSKQEVEDEEDIVTLIQVIDSFEGDEYFSFIESIGNAYLKDKIKFIKSLSKVPDKTQDVAYVLFDLRIYDRNDQSVFDDLDMIVNSEELTNQQKRVGIDLINFYSACST